MKSIAIPQSEKAMDECGVFGFYNNDGFDSIAVTHDALYGLQHRGQISAGITVNDGGNFSTVKELGMVSEVFPPKARLLISFYAGMSDNLATPSTPIPLLTTR